MLIIFNILNIYYKVKQDLAIGEFWKEILKMDLIPMGITLLAIIALSHFELQSWLQLAIAILMYALVYLPLFYMFSMNKDEKALIIEPINKILNRKNT